MPQVHDDQDDLFASLEDLENIVDLSDETKVVDVGAVSAPDEREELDFLKKYFQEIAAQPLLNKDQEFWCGVRILADQILYKWPESNSEASKTSPNPIITKIYLEAYKNWQTVVERSINARLAFPDLGEILTEAFNLQSKIFLEDWSIVRLWIEDNRLDGDQNSKILARSMINVLACFTMLPDNIISWLSGHIYKNPESLPAEKLLKNYLSEVKSKKIDLERIKQQADRAREILIISNLRLVVSIAKHYQRRNVPLADLIQEGSLGLIKAIEKYDPSLGYKFSTYGTWWIRQSISRYIADYARLVRIPVHLFERLTKILRIQEKLIQILGREPEIYEIALESDFLSDEDAKTIARSINSTEKNYNLPTALKQELDSASKKVAAILILAEEPVSLDRPLGDAESSHLGEFIEDDEALEPMDAAAREMLRDQVQSALGALSERERQVLELRFGLGGGDEHTLEEVSNYFVVTRERIRQIEAKALRKLRHPTRSRHLREYLS